MKLLDEEMYADMLDSLQPASRGLEDHTLRAELVLAEDVAEFVASDLGRYMLDRANQEILTHLHQLAVASADNVALVRNLQHEVRVREMFKQYLLESLVAGRTALSELENRSVIE
jgi:hypothetical protein